MNADYRTQIGKLFQERRSKFGLSIGEVSEQIKIAPKYIRRIEEERWSELPSQAYVIGFISSYADFLELPTAEVIKSYREIIDNQGGVTSIVSDKRNVVSGGWLEKLKAIKRPGPLGLFGSFILLAFLVFLVFQTRHFYLPPRIELQNEEQNIIVNKKRFNLKGQVSYANKLTVNGGEVYSDKNGNFQKELFLSEGINIIEITAAGRFGRETKIIKRIIIYD